MTFAGEGADLSGGAAQVADFLRHMRSARRLSANTVAAYQRELDVLLRRLDGKAPAQATPTDIRRFVSADKNCAATTVSRRLAAWRMFFDYLLEEGAVEANPARSVASPKRPAALPKSLTPDEAASLFREAVAADDALSQRDRAMIELFYSAGLRLSELAALDISDIDLVGGVARVRGGKGGQDRVAPLGAAARRALQVWLSAARAAADDREALFISRRGGRISARMIQKRLARAARRAGLDKPLSPHMLRHSCASHFLQSSRNLRATQELLGHKNISATQIYTRLDFQHLSEIYDKAHPRAQKH